MTALTLLSRFVAPSTEPREYLRSPFLLGDYVYASNVAMAVRVPKDSAPEVTSPPGKQRDIAKLFDDARRSDFVPIPTLPEAQRCFTCHGIGIVGDTCQVCDGDGEFEYGHHIYECKDCGGTGKMLNEASNDSCDTCGGTGQRPRQSVRIGEALYARWLLAEIIDLPGIRVSPAGPGDAAYFVFDGGEGLLMPMRE